jgi:hypothetical protein
LLILIAAAGAALAVLGGVGGLLFGAWLAALLLLFWLGLRLPLQPRINQQTGGKYVSRDVYA